MENNKNFEQLFQYVNKTLTMIKEGYLPNELGEGFIKQLEPLLLKENGIEKLMGFAYVEHHDYWTHLFISKPQQIIEYLECSMQKSLNNSPVFKLTVENFLNLPSDIKKEFYEKNFTQIKPVTLKGKSVDGNIVEKKVERVFLCEKPYEILKAKDKIFHNLPSLYLHGKNKDELFEKICQDIKKTLNLEHSKFLDIYGKSIILNLKRNEIKENWKEFEMDKRNDFQQIYALKYYKTRQYGLNERFFLNDLKENKVSYDLQLPNGSFVMEGFINTAYYGIFDFFRSINPDKKILIELLEEKTLLLNEVTPQYSKYFSVPNVVNKTIDLLKKKVEEKYKNDTQVVQAMLDFILKTQELSSSKEMKETKKVKI